MSLRDSDLGELSQLAHIDWEEYSTVRYISLFLVEFRNWIPEAFWQALDKINHFRTLERVLNIQYPEPMKEWVCQAFLQEYIFLNSEMMKMYI